MSLEFWRGKRVFLTGHTGFMGSWISLWLQNMGADVVGYSLPPPTIPSLFDVARVGEGMTSVIADVRDLDKLYSVVSTQRPEIVFHFAAQPLVRYSYQEPVETYSTNVMGTAHLLEAVRRFGGVRVVVNITSDKCYENREWEWGYRESEPLGGYDPYSNSKACAELVTAAYRSSFFNPENYKKHGVGVATARAGNVIGGGDWAKDRLIPDILASFIGQQPAVIRNPLATRPWQHVLEALRGNLMLAQRLWNDGPAFAEAWNFGPNDQDVKPVKWVVTRLAREWGDGAAWVSAKESHPHEAGYLKLDCSKAKARLGWYPVWNLRQALCRVVEWARAYQTKADMRLMCLNQISDYEKAISSAAEMTA